MRVFSVELKTQYGQVAFAALGLIAAVVLSEPLLADNPETMNERQHIDNRIRNKIANARLRGMMAGIQARAEINDGIGEESDCVTQIGNYSLDSGSRPSEQDIIILGDVINVCR